MTTDIDAMLPVAAAAAHRALKRLVDAGVQSVTTCTKRTFDEQRALWMQGRYPLEQVNAQRKAAGMDPIVEYTGKDGKVHSDNDYTITNSDGVALAQGGKGRSMHQLGLAIDQVPDMDPSEKQVPGWPAPSDPRWEQIAAAFEAEGFEWGGRWTVAKDGIAPDYPHYQYTKALS